MPFLGRRDPYCAVLRTSDCWLNRTAVSSTSSLCRRRFRGPDRGIGDTPTSLGGSDYEGVASTPRLLQRLVRKRDRDAYLVNTKAALGSS